jgi:hypothetical protein
MRYTGVYEEEGDPGNSSGRALPSVADGGEEKLLVDEQTPVSTGYILPSIIPSNPLQGLDAANTSYIYDTELRTLYRVPI